MAGSGRQAQGAARRRPWSAGGQALSRGTWITAALWVVSLAVHLGYDAVLTGKDARGLGSASILLYMPVTFALQRLIVQYRAQRLGLSTGPERNSGRLLPPLP